MVALTASYRTRRDPLRKKQLKRSRENTRSLLLEAAREIIAEHGLAGTNVEKICSAAGFTRGAFYSNYEDLAELIADILNAEYRELLEALESSSSTEIHELTSASATDKASALYQAVTGVLSALPLDREFFLLQSEFKLFEMRNPHSSEKVHASHRAFRHRLEELLSSALSQVGRRSKIPMSHFTTLLMTIVQRFYIEPTATGEDHELESFSFSLLPTILMDFTEASIADNETVYLHSSSNRIS